jgi:dipeptidyl aminopeptidase
MMVTSNSTSKPTVTAEKGHRDFDDIDRIITDVHWATDSHTHLLFKQTNRIQDKQFTNLLTITDANGTASPHGKTSASVGTVHDYIPTDGGWIDSGKTMVFFGQYLNSDGTWQVDYIDVAADGNGFMHLAMVSVGKQTTQVRWLTSGDWEVESESVTVDRKRELL